MAEPHPTPAAAPSPVSPRHSSPQPLRRQRLIAVAILIIVTVATFGRSIHNQFTNWDDNFTIWDNPLLNPPSMDGVIYFWQHQHMSLYVPVTYTFWETVAALCYRADPYPDGAHLNAAYFHAGSILIHLGTVLVVFALLDRLLGSVSAACIGALLYSVHPVQAEPVCWTSGAKDLLCGMFTLAAVWQYAIWAGSGSSRRSLLPPAGAMPPGQRRLHYVLGLLFMILGALSKPTALVAPLLAGTIDLAIIRRRPSRVFYSLAPWLIVSYITVFIGQTVQQAQNWSPVWTRPFIAGDALAFYIVKLILPIWLGYDYGRSPVWVVAHRWMFVTPLLPLLVAVLICVCKPARRWLGVAGALFVLGLLPVLGLKTFLFQYFSTVADHYLYIPMFGVALAAAWLISRRATPAVLAVAAILISVLAIRTAVQTTVWSDSTALFTHVIDRDPNNALALHDLGAMRYNQKDYQQAEQYLSRSLKVLPDYAESHSSLAMVYYRTGRRAAAIAELREALRLQDAQPKNQARRPPDLHARLGKMLMESGNYPAAAAEYAAQLELTPADPTATQGLIEARNAGPATTQATP
jgi:tetratricopeptide (TPR) repeat protein